MTSSIVKSDTTSFKKQKNKIVIRHSLKADMNPSIPDEGEIIFATDTRDLLIGDGVTRIEDLPAVGGAEYPEQTGHSGEFLTTNGSEVSWANLPQADWNQSDTDAPDYIKNKPYIPEGIIVDQTYDATSTNAQSGTAVAEAVSSVDTALDNHIADKNNPHEVTKAQVGLGNVDNTADIDKPISTVTQTALDNKVTKNADITGATKCKITYDEKGLVTAGADLQASDIPDISATYQTKLDANNKLSTDYISGLATVATSGDYGDLSNKPTIPAAQVNSDWNSTTGVTEILNKPTLSLVATSGDYNDLLNKPYIPAGVIVDQTYNSSSTNPQSGTAVAEAISDKISQSSSTSIVYGTDNAGQQSLITYTSSNTGSTIAQRDSNGQLYVAETPTLNTHAASKKYVDDNVNTVAGDLSTHIADTNNPHNVTASQIGLGNVDNTSDLNKPISTATQTALDSKQATLVSGTNIKTINNNSLLGSGDITIDSLPSQTSQSGKFLTTDGTDASWADIPTEIPTQTGQSGKYLTTDGSSLSWSTVDALPSQSGNSGKYLTTNGTIASWNSLATVAITGSYNDLSNTPNIPTVNDATITVTQGGVSKGSFTLNQSSAATIALDDNIGATITLRDWSI